MRLEIHSFSEEAGRFYSPHAIAVDSSGEIYLAEVSRTKNYYGIIPPRTGPDAERRSIQKLVRKVVSD